MGGGGGTPKLKWIETGSNLVHSKRINPLCCVHTGSAHSRISLLPFHSECVKLYIISTAEQTEKTVTVEFLAIVAIWMANHQIQSPHARQRQLLLCGFSA